MKNIFIIIIVWLFISCENREKQLVGHWHEFKKGNPDILNCHKITDSTYSQNSQTYGSSTPYKRGVAIQKNEIISNDYVFTSDFSISNTKLTVNDSIY